LPGRPAPSGGNRSLYLTGEAAAGCGRVQPGTSKRGDPSAVPQRPLGEATMYEVRFYRGDYLDRQLAANRDRCVAYVEHHFNSTAGTGGSYAAVIVGSNASNTSKNWARWYARAVADSFGIGLAQPDGVVVGGFSGRGDGNVKFTDMPAVLLEPLFANNPAHAQWIRSEDGQTRLAQILADSIERFFPNGGTVAFSVGHKYKTSNPNDRGAAVAGGGTEADYAEIVLGKAAALLEAKRAPAAMRPFAVYVNNRERWRFDADPDALVRYDELRGILFIDEPGALAPAPAPARAVAPARRAGQPAPKRRAAAAGPSDASRTARQPPAAARKSTVKRSQSLRGSAGASAAAARKRAASRRERSRTTAGKRSTPVRRGRR
jgi:hypothetical protein